MPSVDLRIHQPPKPDAPCLLLLHAFPLDSKMWLPVIIRSTEMEQEFGIATVDLPGFGSVAASKRWTMTEAVDEIARSLEANRIPRVIIGGLSMGGYAAFEFYRRYPERVSGLILSNTKAEADTPKEKESRMEFAADAIRRGPIAAVERQLEKFFSDATKRDHPALVIEVRDLMMAQSPSALANALYAMAGRADSIDLLEHIHVPVTVIAGSDDPLSPSNNMRIMTAKIKNADFVEIGEAAHLSALEKPEQWANAAMNLIQRASNVR